MEKTILEKKGFELKNFDEGTFYVYEMDEEAIIKKNSIFTKDKK